MNSKCVLYVRVSSDIQDYERQIVELKQVAKKENLLVPEDGIFEDKMSGFKDENERIGLKSLMNYCLKKDVKIVLVWELSRLARKHLVLLRLADFFSKNKINVYVKKQDLWLFNENFEMDERAGLMISVLGWFGEYEAKLMKERFISQKKLNESQGKYNGGKIPFGYKLDKENKYVIDEDKIPDLDVSPADVVREVFNYYEQGLVCSKICRICRSKGYPKIVTSTHTLARLLRNTTYIGTKEAKLGTRPTPSIISESQYFKVNDLINKNKTKADKGRKHIYLLRGLLRCSYCESYYVGKQTDDGYICPKNSGSNKTNKNTSCKGGNISISNIDGIIWERAKSKLRYWKVKGFDDQIDYQSQIDDLNIQIDRYHKLLEELDKERSRINFIFKKGGYSSDQYSKEIDAINKEKKNYAREIGLLESEISYYEKESSNNLSRKQARTERFENIAKINDRARMKDLIRDIVKEVYFYKIGLFKTVLFIYFRDNPNPECILYNSVSKKGNTFRRVDPSIVHFDKTTNQFFVLKEPYMVKTDTCIDDEHRPFPDETNSYILDFDSMMNTQQFTNSIHTYQYQKLEYFKDLNTSRFNRNR